MKYFAILVGITCVIFSNSRVSYATTTNPEVHFLNSFQGISTRAGANSTALTTDDRRIIVLATRFDDEARAFKLSAADITDPHAPAVAPLASHLTLLTIGPDRPTFYPTFQLGAAVRVQGLLLVPILAIERQASTVFLVDVTLSTSIRVVTQRTIPASSLRLGSLDTYHGQGRNLLIIGYTINQGGKPLQIFDLDRWQDLPEVDIAGPTYGEDAYVLKLMTEGNTLSVLYSSDAGLERVRINLDSLTAVRSRLGDSPGLSWDLVADWQGAPLLVGLNNGTATSYRIGDDALVPVGRFIAERAGSFSHMRAVGTTTQLLYFYESGSRYYDITLHALDITQLDGPVPIASVEGLGASYVENATFAPFGGKTLLLSGSFPLQQGLFEDGRLVGFQELEETATPPLAGPPPKFPALFVTSPEGRSLMLSASTDGLSTHVYEVRSGQ